MQRVGRLLRAGRRERVALRDVHGPAGNTSGPVAFGFKYDSTPPSALAAPDRAPNANGWYRSSLRISFTQAAGDLSGPDTCTAPIDYAGPDAALGDAVRDVHGQGGEHERRRRGVTFKLRRDRTPAGGRRRLRRRSRRTSTGDNRSRRVVDFRAGRTTGPSGSTVHGP